MALNFFEQSHLKTTRVWEKTTKNDNFTKKLIKENPNCKTDLFVDNRTTVFNLSLMHALCLRTFVLYLLLRSTYLITKYLLDYKKNIRFDFDDELKIGYVRYKHLT